MANPPQHAVYYVLPDVPNVVPFLIALPRGDFPTFKKTIDADMIERVYVGREGIIVICDEDGLPKKRPQNPWLRAGIVGTAILANEDFGGLTRRQIEFAKVHIIDWTGGGAGGLLLHGLGAHDTPDYVGEEHWFQSGELHIRLIYKGKRPADEDPARWKLKYEVYQNGVSTGVHGTWHPLASMPFAEALRSAAKKTVQDGAEHGYWDLDDTALRSNPPVRYVERPRGIATKSVAGFDGLGTSPAKLDEVHWFRSGDLILKVTYRYKLDHPTIVCPVGSWFFEVDVYESEEFRGGKHGWISAWREFVPPTLNYVDALRRAATSVVKKTVNAGFPLDRTALRSNPPVRYIQAPTGKAFSGLAGDVSALWRCARGHTFAKPVDGNYCPKCGAFSTRADARLVYTNTRTPVNVGDVIVDRGDRLTVTGWRAPHKPGSTGRVVVAVRRGKAAPYAQEFFPNVIGAEWENLEGLAGFGALGSAAGVEKMVRAEARRLATVTYQPVPHGPRARIDGILPPDLLMKFGGWRLINFAHYEKHPGTHPPHEVEDAVKILAANRNRLTHYGRRPQSPSIVFNEGALYTLAHAVLYGYPTAREGLTSDDLGALGADDPTKPRMVSLKDILPPAAIRELEQMVDMNLRPEFNRRGRVLTLSKLKALCHKYAQHLDAKGVDPTYLAYFLAHNLGATLD